VSTCTDKVEILDLPMSCAWTKAEYVEEGVTQSKDSTFVQIELLLPGRRCIDNLVDHERPDVGPRSEVYCLKHGIARF